MRRDPLVYCLTLLSIPYGAVKFSLPERARYRSARLTPEEKLSGGAFILSSLLCIALTSTRN